MCLFKPGFHADSGLCERHEWLARKLEANGVCYTKHDNVFFWIEDMARGQRSRIDSPIRTGPSYREIPAMYPILEAAPRPRNFDGALEAALGGSFPAKAKYWSE
jgi:hypothetical protein